MRIDLRLSLPPSVNRLWRANRGRVHKSNRYTAWLKQAHGEWLEQRGKIRGIQGRYRLSVVAYAPDRRYRDISNISKALEDFLVAAGIIEDDHLCRKISMEWADEISDQGCYITIETL